MKKLNKLSGCKAGYCALRPAEFDGQEAPGMLETGNTLHGDEAWRGSGLS
jgi:hypothetical protein